ncbi:MAG: YceI family protein [Steroidobacteraceae bacterium]
MRSIGSGRRVALICLLAGAWLAACRTPPPPPPPQPPPAPPAPEVVPERIDHYVVDADASQVLVLVYRDGPMAKLGHNHVIAVHQLTGEVLIPKDIANGSFTLSFPVAGMSVDDRALRADLGDDFKGPVDANSIAGTREHMLGEKLLNALQFPMIKLESGPLRSEGDHWIVTLNISVHGHVSAVEVPVMLTMTPAALTASGQFDLTHAQLGLTPYSVGHGALRVAETMHVRFRLVARNDASDAGPQTP